MSGEVDRSVHTLKAVARRDAGYETPTGSFKISLPSPGGALRQGEAGSGAAWTGQRNLAGRFSGASVAQCLFIRGQAVATKKASSHPHNTALSLLDWRRVYVTSEET